MGTAMSPKERVHAILQGKPFDRPAVTPIFMSWAAHFIGRSYRDFYLDGRVLVESQLAVTKAFNVDQISAISDPWREASAYGMEFDYPAEGVGRPRGVFLKTPQDVARLRVFDIENAERTRQRIESVAAMAGEVGQTHSVLGWLEGPIAEYADLRGVESMFLDLIDSPEMYEQAAKVITQNQIRFARAQVKAGADVVGIGDSVASLISPRMYGEYVLPFERALVDAVHEAGAATKLHVCGNISNNIALMAQTGTDMIDVDWMVSLADAREAVGPDVTLCGNFDPAGALLQGTPEDVAEAARECIASGGERFILQPGCEVPPGTAENNIRAFCPCRGSLLPGELRL